ncbi:hypothetical protein C8R44DRAFT_434418 [Mycena epipterygia]|nr:hypothetical protein C8R44DRAFT_434418 [Mycena epipterygia]
MAHVTQSEEGGRRFFLTGHPGIGKSLGACYCLFWLLASHQPVFFIPTTDRVYYFSKDGVQQSIDAEFDDRRLEATVKRSWVLVDVDIGDNVAAAEWYPRQWTKSCAALVCFVSAAQAPAPVHKRLFRPCLVHEPVVAGRNRGRNVSLVFDTALTDLAK